jgi:hypothetical protein
MNTHLCYGRESMAARSPVCPMRDTCESYRRAVFGWDQDEPPHMMACGPSFRMRVPIKDDDAIVKTNAQRHPSGT